MNEAPTNMQAFGIGIVGRQLKSWGGLARLVILLAVLAVGWLMYSGEWRTIATEIGSRYGRYTLRSDAVVDAQASNLLRQTGAASVAVYSVFENQRRVIYMRLADGRNREYEGVGDVLWPVGDHEMLDDNARLMAGEIVCRDYAPRTAAGEFLLSRGVTWVCSVRAPYRSDGFAGIIALGFKGKPTHSQYVNARLKETADAITE